MSWSEASARLNVPYAVAELIVSAATVLGNSFVLVAFRREKKLRRRTNYYIISLALADMLVGLVGIPCAVMASVGLPRRLHPCLFSVSLLVVLCTISIFSLVAVSVDRYWAILYPMSYSRNVTSKLAFGIICFCWFAGAFVGFLPILGWNAGPQAVPECQFTKVMDYNYLVFLYFATIIIPALLLAAFYAHIYSAILRQLRKMVTFSSSSTGNRGRISTPASIRILADTRRKEVKATQNLSIIVVFFILCWMPLYTINCMQAFCENCKVPELLLNFCIILSHMNSAGNPLLYAYRLSDFRAAFKRLLFRSTSSSGNILRGDVTKPRVLSINLNSSKYKFSKNSGKLFRFDSSVVQSTNDNEKMKYVKESTDTVSTGPDRNENYSYVNKEDIGNCTYGLKLIKSDNTSHDSDDRSYILMVDYVSTKSDVSPQQERNTAGQDLEERQTTSL